MKSSLIGLVLVGALAGATGCGDDGAPAGDPTLLAAIPADGFTGRSVNVVLVGEDTGWIDGATADFGDGVTVESTEVIGTGALLATVSIAKDAALGARDVTVTGADGSTALMSGFELKSPISLDVQGTLAQGSATLVTITNDDMAHPFDPTTTGDGLFTPISYTNFDAILPDGMSAVISTVSPFSAELVVLTDVNATVGAVNLEVKTGSSELLSSVGSLDVTARTPMDLTSGTPATGNVTDAFDSMLYKLTPAEFSRLNFAITTTSMDAGPRIALLPASGSFDDLISFRNAVTTVGDGVFYAVVWENAGIAPYDFSLSADVAAASHAAEAEANDDFGTAQAVASLPGVVTDANLSSVDDEDWYAVTIAAGDAGKALHVVTLPGSPSTDTVVEVFDTDGTTTLGGPSDDLGVHEDWVSDALPSAGTYYVKVSASVDFFNPSFKDYQVLIELTNPPTN